VSGGVSIETLRMNTRPERWNHCASFDSRSGVEQPAISGASAHNANSRFEAIIPLGTMNPVPTRKDELAAKRLSDHHFAARPWPDASTATETSNYH
jgi:hypothetical protein